MLGIHEATPNLMYLFHTQNLTLNFKLLFYMVAETMWLQLVLHFDTKSKLISIRSQVLHQLVCQTVFSQIRSQLMSVNSQ